MKKIKKTKKLKLKKKYARLLKRIVLFLMIVFFVLIIFTLVLHIYKKNKIVIEKVNISDDTIEITLSNKYKDSECILSTTTPTDNDEWIKVLDKKCTSTINTGYKYLYIKKDNKIKRIDTLSEYKINEKENIYLPTDGNYEYIKYYIGDYNSIETEYDNKIIDFIDGKISSKSIGSTTLKININGKSYETNVTVTDTIVTAPKDGYDYDKRYLKCNEFSEEESKLLDEILKSRIEDAGYKTRAGAVEAARFLTLEFPYRINYFYENGRQTTNNVDGEGRYYHEGLYLSETKYQSITGSKTGPKMWGCSLYSNPAKRYIDNGLDCSGFVSWALLNSGFDVKDVGAGFSTKSDLTDFGELKKLTKTLATSDTIKPGDLLHSNAAGGHIAIIIGIDSEYYYVAQALWYDEIGVIISKYKKNKLPNSFNEVVLMDKYYINDGNLTYMW